MKILLIDNYDSFTYNLLQLIRSAAGLSAGIDVILNDRVTPRQAAGYDRIVISPGPGLPHRAGNLPAIIRETSPTVPTLGICLGHQAIGEAFGAKVIRQKEPFHGIQSEIKVLRGFGLFNGIGERFLAGRYHSWGLCCDNFPKELQVDAVTSTGDIMAVSHRHYNIHGIQFHPESVMTPCGNLLMTNFLHG